MDFLPTICLDGAAIRRIREEKRLTQLYVAKVVGVTTDTISRWENNRYPTVRRENLYKLGEALDVPYAQLIKSKGAHPCASITEDGTELAPPTSGRWIFFKPWLALTLLLLTVALVAFFSIKYQAVPVLSADFSGTRILPRYAAAGAVIPVRLRLDIDTSTRGYIVREHFPAGWELIESSPPASSIDNQDGMARWIIKQGETRPSITYLVRVDAKSPRKMIGRFSGEIIGNLDEKSQSIKVEGDTECEVAPFSWADFDGNRIVDDTEMLNASEAFEEMEGVHLDWKQLELLWDAGHYRFDESTHRFLPERVDHAPLTQKSGTPGK